MQSAMHSGSPGKKPASVNDGGYSLWNSPPSGEQVHLDKGVRVAAALSGREVPCLQDVDDEVAQTAVIVDLKL